MNAITRPKSTERYKVQIEKSAYDRLIFIASVLSERRFIDHTLSEAMDTSMHFSLENFSVQTQMLAKYYVKSGEEIVVIKVTKKIKDRIHALSKEFNVTMMAVADAIITIFTKSILSSIWRQKGADYGSLTQQAKVLMSGRKTPFLKTSKAANVNVKYKRLRSKREITMRHHNYISEFQEYMQKFGGIDKWLNKNVYIMIHAMPLQGSMDRTTEMDQPKESNPGTVFTARLWKRGRGYNITILDSHDSYGEDPPELEIGSVYRLYDIHRNIDWHTLKLV
jgi:hypothetical protein